MADAQYRLTGCSNHTDKDRAAYDYYATDPAAIDFLLSGGAKLSQHLWECACGEGHLSKKLSSLGYDVKSTDLIDRGFGEGGWTSFSVHQCLMGILSLIHHLTRG